jgi:hypothetical protein
MRCGRTGAFFSVDLADVQADILAWLSEWEMDSVGGIPSPFKANTGC